MRYYVRPTILFTVLLLAGCGGERLPLADGATTRLDDWRDRWVVINYWAEWCAPCRDEIPEFNRLYYNAGAGGPLVVGVNYDELRGNDLTDVIARMDVRFPVLSHDPRERFGYERPPVLPTTVVLRPGLNVASVLRGPQTVDTIRAAIAAAGEDAG
ncbi:MAG: TlpA family protein disulfide reductase [Pseudomonadales bacterium]|nr:TlpA family protein disulfide reductase [Pseudomonadales bacterium]MCP5184538.1 TlpA family protein disulfide reductase [Pseudomonadales bacterium]